MITSGHWVGTYNLHWLRTEMNGYEPKPIYRFDNDLFDPLTWINDNGTWARPAQSFETDMGSVPAILQGIVSPLASSRGFPMHDSAFENHGLWISADKGATWVFILLTEQDVNDALHEWCRADEVNQIESEEILWGVQLGGTALWNGHKGPFPVDPPPIDAAIPPVQLGVTAS